ncbi:MAG TPA: cation diffusion facilitator family transporter [Candidatus Saccharimonadales bacterium]|nr:cation diffusion facilitator family transporter [Candidatus Saccharimonadales bacterium]
MSHDHDASHSEKGIKFGLLLNTAYTIVEFGFGIFTGSLALIADASRNLTDTLTLTISFVANKIARRKANDTKTFGYGRATILAALLNSVIMLGVAAFIVSEAIQRLSHPQEVEGGIVAMVALVGIAVNGSIAYILYKQRNDLNMRSAFIDMAFDALSSLGAVIAGLVILFTDIQWIDSAVGLLIAGLLVYNTIKIIKEAVGILLEGTPRGVEMSLVSDVILKTEAVLRVDDMHIWAIRSGYNALSCHIAIDEAQLINSRKIVEEVKTRLLKEANIHHATIEVELMECETHTEHEKH